MNQRRMVRGTELRYLLTMYLFRHGICTVAELTAALAADGFAVPGRPSKVVSDALRWECLRQRVLPRGRGRYGPGWMPRGTEYRIHKRVLALRDEARELSREAGQTRYTPGADTDETPGV